MTEDVPHHNLTISNWEMASQPQAKLTGPLSVAQRLPHLFLIAFSFSVCALRTSFCLGVSSNFPSFLLRSSSFLRSSNIIICSLWLYTLLDFFTFFRFRWSSNALCIHIMLGKQLGVWGFLKVKRYSILLYRKNDFISKVQRHHISSENIPRLNSIILRKLHTFLPHLGCIKFLLESYKWHNLRLISAPTWGCSGDYGQTPSQVAIWCDQQDDTIQRISVKVFIRDLWHRKDDCSMQYRAFTVLPLYMWELIENSVTVIIKRYIRKYVAQFPVNNEQ